MTSGGQTGQPSMASRVISILDDALILRFAFYVLLFGVAATLLMDYRELAKEDAEAEQMRLLKHEPILPSYTPPTLQPDETQPARERERPSITTDRETLKQSMEIELTGGGVLSLNGSITVGMSELFEQRIDGITEYIKTIELNSPGGSVFDAIAISDKIRENGWSTLVRAGNLCASSCPLIFAGGKKRIADKGAAIGVHQIFSLGEDKRSNVEAVSGTQRTTATITRHLEKMGVDPVLWIHALETPPHNLFYLNRDELEKFRLITD